MNLYLNWTSLAGESMPNDLVFVDVETGELRGNPDAEMLDGVFVRPIRPGRCGRALTSKVGVHANPEAGTAHFGMNAEGERSIERCGSISSCPVCSPVIRHGRAEKIGQVVQAHQARGGHVYFLTLTVRHSREHTLSNSLDVVLEGWRAFQRRQMWRGSKRNGITGLRDRLGMKGFVRALEVTVGPNAGWHPHLHMLLLTENPADVGTMKRDIIHEWRSVIHGISPEHEPSQKHAVDLQHVDGAGIVLGRYLSKIDSEQNVGDEMARMDWKRGRKENLAPFQLLDTPVDEFGDVNTRLKGKYDALWIEYVKTMHGRRVIEFSRGLVKELLEEEEQTDDELMDETESDEWVMDIPRDAYTELRRDGQATGEFLNACADGEFLEARLIVFHTQARMKERRAREGTAQAPDDAKRRRKGQSSMRQ